MALSPPSGVAAVAIDNLPTALSGGAVTIGNFDGIHPGHQALLAATRRMAERLRAPALALTFEPHPRSVLSPGSPIFRITPPLAKLRLVAALGLDGLVHIPFNEAIAAQSADAFIRAFLVERLAVRGVVVGDDFRFGHRRSGTVAILEAAGAEQGFAVETVAAVTDPSGARYGSGRVREALVAGDVAVASALLAYRWFVIATVEHGDKRGRELGYPTANLHLPPDCALRHGIYAVSVGRAGEAARAAVASFGRRPTFGGGVPILEVHLFDFSGSLYGETLTVTFHAWLRPEEHFASIDALVVQMNQDSQQARAVLAAAGPGNVLDQRLAALVAASPTGPYRDGDIAAPTLIA